MESRSSPADTRLLSGASQSLMQDLTTDATAWRKGWERRQSLSGMTQAAFAMMKGQPIPVDPVYEHKYQREPATRQLSAPSSPEFKELDLQPITGHKL